MPPTHQPPWNLPLRVLTSMRTCLLLGGGREARMSTPGVFLAVGTAIQPRLHSSATTKASPAIAVRMRSPRGVGVATVKQGQVSRERARRASGQTSSEALMTTDCDRSGGVGRLDSRHSPSGIRSSADRATQVSCRTLMRCTCWHECGSELPLGHRGESAHKPRLRPTPPPRAVEGRDRGRVWRSCRDRCR